MRWPLSYLLSALSALMVVGIATGHPPQQAPRPAQTTVREIPGTPDKVFVQPGTPGVRETITREEIPPPPATVHYLPQAPMKVKHAAPAYYEAPTYYAPARYAPPPTYYAPPRYAPPTYYMAPAVYAAPAYVMVPKRVRPTPIRDLLFGP